MWAIIAGAHMYAASLQVCSTPGEPPQLMISSSTEPVLCFALFPTTIFWDHIMFQLAEGVGLPWPYIHTVFRSQARGT